VSGSISAACWHSHLPASGSAVATGSDISAPRRSRAAGWVPIQGAVAVLLAGHTDHPRVNRWLGPGLLPQSGRVKRDWLHFGLDIWTVLLPPPSHQPADADLLRVYPSLGPNDLTAVFWRGIGQALQFPCFHHLVDSRASCSMKSLSR